MLQTFFSLWGAQSATTTIMSSAYEPAAVAPITTMASAMLFGTIIFATTTIAARAFMIGDHKHLFDAASHPRSSALNVKSLPSVFTLLFHSSIFGLILFYAYICEYHPPHPHADKNYDADIFFFLTFLLFVVSAFTWQKHVDEEPKSVPGTIAPSNDKTEVLNRNQTEEWKGWMQFMFLLYHYYHAENVYNSIRIMITCYVWMTGFGNFSFFYIKGDYGIIRVLQMLWRLNFLVLFLCLTQGTTFILYYICLLHTYYFFMVYIVMRIGNEHNYTKWWIRIKLAVLGLVIFLVWDCDIGLFKLIHLPFFGETPMMGATGGSMWEWYFRSSLDHWSTYMGMIFALNFPITSLFFRKIESMPMHQQVLSKGLMGVGLAIAFYYWVTGPFMQGKFDYNQTNAYYGIVPVTVYIYFRNMTPFLRNHSLDLLHQIGKTTLETYLMQHHIWLTSDAKSLLTLIPGWPKVNFLVVSVIYVVMSRRLYQLTLFLRGMMLPNNREACLKNLAGMVGVIISVVALAHFMKALDMLNLHVIGFVSIVGGYFLSSSLLKQTGAMEASMNEALPTSTRRLNPTTMVVSCAIAAIAVASCGLGWHTAAVTGAGKISLLPATCANYANDGQWMSLNGCDEGPRGQEYRSFGVSTVSTCSAQNEVYVWGWNEQASSTHCRFKQRDVKSLKKHLQGRTIIFAGDSITRYLYHSFCRQLGLSESGAFNFSAGKHHDISQRIKSADITLEFKWASYATDVVQAVESFSAMDSKPDLVVLGGGAWDKLHFYNEDAEKEKLEQVVEDLAKKMEALKKKGVPTVWLTPTTINTPALPSDEKQERISEDDMQLIRELYDRQGVLSAASFVIDGESFTSGRVSESYDGVHYPHHVYSAGGQILCNAADWLLPTPKLGPPPKIKQPGEMSHPSLGLMMLCFAAAGLFLFDGFMGFSYLAAIFIPSVSPKGLYFEAFSILHQNKQLPPLEMNGLTSPTSVQSNASMKANGLADDSDDMEEDEGTEIVSLIGKER